MKQEFGMGLIANFKYEHDKPSGPPSHNGKHLGFLFESVIYHYLYHASEGSAVSTYYLSKDMRGVCDVIMMQGKEASCHIELKSRRAIDGSFNPYYLMSEYKKSLSALQEFDQPFALIVGQYQDEVNTVVEDLAYFDEGKGIYTAPPASECHEAADSLEDWYKFYAYVGHGEFGGWLDLSSEESPLAQILDITDPNYAQCPLIEIAEGLSADAGMRDLEGYSVLSLQEYKKLYLPSANIEPEPETPNPIEVLEAKIAKHRENARRHHQEAEELNDCLLKASNNLIVHSVHDEFNQTNKRLERLEDKASKVDSQIFQDFQKHGKYLSKSVDMINAELQLNREALAKKYDECVSASSLAADQCKGDINANKDNIDLLDDRLKELSEKVTILECDLLLMKKSHLSNEKREHKNRELIDHLYAQLGEDQDG
ncbi:MAG: hypothetical protein CL816_03430 [Coxiellaceae bacterium]|nr:hypothetical protein [Coxiellaceae bacterium]